MTVAGVATKFMKTNYKKQNGQFKKKNNNKTKRKMIMNYHKKRY